MKTVLEILKKLKRFDINTQWITNSLFAGGYKSVFKGQGMRFKELREYSPGDDIRFIDWNVTARLQRIHTKIFEEERETTVYILVDNSSSTHFGSSESKRDLITQLCADLSYSTIKNNDKTGLIIFNSSIERHVPPNKSSEHIQYLIRILEAAQTKNGKTNIAKALKFINNIIFQKSTIFIISDFIDNNYEKALGILARRHNVIGLHIIDKMDKALPKIGLIEVSDFEIGEKFMIDSSNKTVRKIYADQFNDQNNYTINAFIKAGALLLQLETGKDYHPILQNFFMTRTR